MATYVTIEKTIRQIVVINSDVSLEEAKLQPLDLIKVAGVVVGEAVVGERVTEVSPVPERSPLTPEQEAEAAQTKSFTEMIQERDANG